MERRQFGEIVLWQFDHLAAHPGLVHGVTARHGGVSEGRYASLNLGLHVGDDPAAVMENRCRACAAAGLEFTHLTFGAQVHGAELAEVGEEEVGAGREDLAAALPGVDGLIVRDPGITAMVLSADCVPLLFFDPRRRIAAAVHAGWRGTAAGMAGRAVAYLTGRGSSPADLLVGIGPSIGPCCYQVSAEVAATIGASLPYREPVVAERVGGWYADLAAANRQQLVAAGVPEARIEVAGICTSCHADEFFSERKLGRPTGRLAAFVGLR